MLNKVLTTPVDTLIQELKEKKIMSFKEIELKLKLPLSIIQRWIVILEEYKIIKTSYKGLDGFVQLVENQKKTKEPEIEEIKLLFIDKCKEKGLTFEDMKKIWPTFLEEYKEAIKKEFEIKANKKGFATDKIKIAWSRFEKDLVRF
jgi:DNA-binding transcriptional regulator YhcF (GntR family)